MKYTIKASRTGGFDIVDELELVVSHFPIVEDAATRLIEIVRPDLDPTQVELNQLLQFRSEVSSNIDNELQRRVSDEIDAGHVYDL